VRDARVFVGGLVPAFAARGRLRNASAESAAARAAQPALPAEPPGAGHLTGMFSESV